MSENTWIQIHTNGASTTFARWYEGQDAEGDTVFYFEKMATDFVNNIVEVFGVEEFGSAEGATNRIQEAVALAR
jgi:hypothetical protein